MIERKLGSSDISVSGLGFGCGAVGGLMVRGDYDEMVRTVAYAIDAGITYFDTAALYGNGVSETNLGRVLRELKKDVVVGTKVRLAPTDLLDIPAAVERSIEESLGRLQMDSVDLIQLHNPVARYRDDSHGWINPEQAELAAETLAHLVEQGKARLWGINGLGETDAIRTALDESKPDTIQCCINLLNPSALKETPADFPFQNYKQLGSAAVDQGTGVIAIRMLAGGAMSGTADRHPNAADNVDPIATNEEYAQDVEYARRFWRLVTDGHADSLIEAAIRYVVYADGVSTALVGISNYEQIVDAVKYVERGPLDDDALAMIAEIQQQ